MPSNDQHFARPASSASVAMEGVTSLAASPAVRQDDDEIGSVLCALLLVPVATATPDAAKATGQENHAALTKVASNEGMTS